MEPADHDFIFGIRTVLEAIRAGKTVDRLLVRSEGRGTLYHELLGEAAKLGIPVQYVPVAKIDSITRKNHQGVLAWMSAVEYSDIFAIVPSVFEKGEEPLLLILDGISDVRNFGAIVRSADCLGAHAIIIPEKGSVRAGADAVKTSAGSLLHFPVCRVKSLSRLMEFLRDSGLRIAGVSEKSSLPAHDTGLTGPLALIMGSEDRGISRELLSMCDLKVAIPMSGSTASLNVSVAAGIILYEVKRQRSLTT
ncbi:MAG: 23S rRNA (guanosine(2251)-2'-O)-methyltransferase RlmB [Bacteroidetes bacterium]|nr:23S rRNA (guanosine(2251)-2'-O)-methyltransferase RlmB [Bacteroidota bacterium]